MTMIGCLMSSFACHCAFVARSFVDQEREHEAERGDGDSCGVRERIEADLRSIDCY